LHKATRNATALIHNQLNICELLQMPFEAAVRNFHAYITYTGKLRTGTRVGKATFMQCLEWSVSVSKVAARVKRFWYITTPLVYCVVKYWTRPPSYCWNMASSWMHVWKQKTQKAVI